MKNVIRAVWEPKQALFLTFILFLILEYTFTLWGFIWNHTDYDENCENLLHCFLFTIDQTFKVFFPNEFKIIFLFGNY